jgi:hypothetical protein
MIRVATLTVQGQNHPLEDSLHHQLTEHGYVVDEVETANVLICMGQDIQGFDSTTLQQLEAQITERFLGAELFLLARAFPFARIRVGLTTKQQLLIASPLDESTLYRMIRLLDQFKRIAPEDYESKMGGFKDLLSVPSIPKDKPISEPEPEVDSTSDPAHTTISPEPLTLQQSSDVATLQWNNKLEHWLLRPSTEQFVMPPELQHAGIQQVFQSTTQFETRQNPMGELYGIYGFPDLLRPNSKVLLVTSDGGVVALHRKQHTVILSPMVEDLLFSMTTPFPKWVSELLENKLNTAEVFALEGTRVYGKIDRCLHSVTPQNSAKNEGPTNSVVASLILHWSSR